MEQNIIIPENISDTKTLKEIISRVLKMVGVERIYFNEGTAEHRFKYRLIIIIKTISKNQTAQLAPMIEELFAEYPGYYHRFFPLSYVDQETNNGNLFFLNNCLDKNLIYKDPESDPFWVHEKIDFDTLIKKAKAYFSKDMDKIRSFQQGANFFKNDKNYAQAAFMLHQTIELSFRTLEYFLIGKSKICHRITDHQAYMKEAFTNYGELFLTILPKDKELLPLLDKTYSHARYCQTFQISKEQVSHLEFKAGRIIKEAEKCFDQELLKSEELFKALDPDGFKKSNQTLEPELTANAATIKLKEIKELTADNFRQLSPIVPGKAIGYYMNHIYAHDYLSVFSTLKSLINVAILALDDEEDYTKNIKDPMGDVSGVLEFAKNLIPFEEASYLDKMRELLMSDKKDS